MKWKIKDGMVYDENGDIVAILPPVSHDFNEKTIEVAPMAIEAIHDFVQQVNSGSLKPRSAVKIFEKVLEQYNS